MITFYEFEFGSQLSEEKRQKMEDLLNSLTEEQKEAVVKYGEYQYWQGHDANDSSMS